ncbi:hypothetical protein [Pseudorhodoferax sp.]|uniref:hypothetical protein n=1 Tax=Pseudorhodoferax sp. TaxID=1993553 RepID=UPI0039E28B0D
MRLSLTTYLAISLHERLAYGLDEAGLVLSVAPLGGVVGRILWGWVAARMLDARRMGAVLAAMLAASSGRPVVLVAGLPPALVPVPVVVVGASAVGWNGVDLAEVARQVPRGMAGAATGGTLVFTFFGVVLGLPMLGGLSSLFQSHRAGYPAMAVPTALCCVVLLLRARRVPAAAEVFSTKETHRCKNAAICSCPATGPSVSTRPWPAAPTA